jgi:Fe-Mn family superoxide dismutase
MAFKLPELLYSMDALKPHISPETLEFHHGKHHKAYVDKLNDLIKGTRFEKASLEEILKTAEPGPLFNNAEQHWNHSFYWRSMGPKKGGEPKGRVGDAIKHGFGSFDAFKKKFSEIAVGHFGSGWAWLVRAKDHSRCARPTMRAARFATARRRSSPATCGSTRTTLTIATRAGATSTRGGSWSTGFRQREYKIVRAPDRSFSARTYLAFALLGDNARPHYTHVHATS